MKAIIKKINWENLLLCFLVSLVFFGFYFKISFATDSFFDFQSTPQEVFSLFASNGRLISALGFFIILQFPSAIAYKISFCLAILALTLAIYFLDKLYIRLGIKQNRYLSLLLATVTIISPFIIELFFFLEKGFMISAILFCVLAAFYFERYLSNKTHKNLFFSFLYAFLAIACYQGAFGLFIVLATIVVLVKSDKFSTFIKNTLFSVAIYIIAALLDILISKLLFGGADRMSGGIDIFASLRIILLGTPWIFKTCNIIPHHLYIGLFALLLFSFCFTFQKQNFRAFFLLITKITYLSIVIYLAAIAPLLMISTNNIDLSPRVLYAFGSLFGAVATILIIYNHKNRIFAVIVSLLSITLLSIEFWQFNQIITNQYALNSADMNRAHNIVEEIKLYEEKKSN